MGKGKGKLVDNGGVDPGKGIVWTDDEGIIHIRNSERGTLDRCPQQWWWSWRDGLRPKETAQPLWFGSGIHEALAHYYGPGKKRRKDFIEKFNEYTDMEAEYVRANTGSLDEDKWVEARLLGQTMLQGYVEHYQGDKDWDVIGTEQAFELRIPMFGQEPMSGRAEAYREWIRSGLDWQPGWGLDFFILNGTFDGVYRDRRDRKVKLMEHKTAATVSIGHLPMDNQAGTYGMVAQSVGRAQGWLGPKEVIGDITYNFLRKAMPDDRPKDSQGYSTNKPTKDAFIVALEQAGHVFPTNRAGNPTIPTIAVMEVLCADEYKIEVLGERSKQQPPPLFERHAVRKTPQMRRMQLTRLQDEVQRMCGYVAGVQRITKSTGRDTCPRCPYREMCELHESGSSWTEYRDAMFRAEDPYAIHRKSASA